MGRVLLRRDDHTHEAKWLVGESPPTDTPGFISHLPKGQFSLSFYKRPPQDASECSLGSPTSLQPS